MPWWSKSWSHAIVIEELVGRRRPTKMWKYGFIDVFGREHVCVQPICFMIGKLRNTYIARFITLRKVTTQVSSRATYPESVRELRLP
jgi:hypothetical protein